MKVVINLAEEMSAWVEEYLDDIFDICDIPEKYSDLIYFMFDKPFIFERELDENRVRDVVSILRFPRDFDPEEDDFPVSILEVFVSMSMRVAYEVVGDNNPGKWFELILNNLGLLKHDNGHFNRRQVDEILDDFMKNNGKPGCKHEPFRIETENKSGGYENKNRDNFDIWRQFCMYLTQKCL